MLSKLVSIVGVTFALVACSPEIKSEESSVPSSPASSSARSSIISEYSSGTYINKTYGFSINYPQDWEIHQDGCGGRNSEVYACDLSVDFVPKNSYESDSSDRYRIFYGIDILVFKNETLEGYLNHEVTVDPQTGESKKFREITSFKWITLNGMEGIEFDEIQGDMLGEQKIHRIVIQLGADTFEITTDRAETSSLKKYISTLKKYSE